MNADTVNAVRDLIADYMGLPATVESNATGGLQLGNCSNRGDAKQNSGVLHKIKWTSCSLIEWRLRCNWGFM